MINADYISLKLICIKENDKHRAKDFCWSRILLTKRKRYEILSTIIFLELISYRVNRSIFGILWETALQRAIEINIREHIHWNFI